MPDYSLEDFLREEYPDKYNAKDWNKNAEKPSQMKFSNEKVT